MRSGKAKADTRLSAPDTATSERRRKANERQHRHQMRKALGVRVGRFNITEELVTALVATGQLRDGDDDQERIEQAANKLLANFCEDAIGMRPKI